MYTAIETLRAQFEQAKAENTPDAWWTLLKASHEFLTFSRRETAEAKRMHLWAKRALGTFMVKEVPAMSEKEQRSRAGQVGGRGNTREKRKSNLDIRFTGGNDVTSPTRDQWCDANDINYQFRRRALVLARIPEDVFEYLITKGGVTAEKKLLDYADDNYPSERVKKVRGRRTLKTESKGPEKVSQSPHQNEAHGVGAQVFPIQPAIQRRNITKVRDRFSRYLLTVFADFAACGLATEATGELIIEETKKHVALMMSGPHKNALDGGR